MSLFLPTTAPNVAEWVRKAAGVVNSLINGKQDTLVSGANIKTVNGSSLLGSGDLVVGGAAGGTSFPGSPSSGDLFYRTDRHIQYFYDGAQWLSTQLFTLELQTQDALSPFTASGNLRVANPWWNLYDIYVERFVVGYFNSSSTASNYYTTQIHKRDGTTDTAIGSGLSGQGDTQNSYVSHSEDINAVVGSSVEVLSALFTKTGTCTCHITAAFTYRLVG